MSSSPIPLDQIAAYGEAFRWTLRDLSAADNGVAAAAQAPDDTRRRLEEAERERVRQVLANLANLADRLAEGAARLGLRDTRALATFRQTWHHQDLLRALDVVDAIGAKALFAMRGDDPLAAVERALRCLADLQRVEEEWWRHQVSPPPPAFEPQLDRSRRPTKEHDERISHSRRSGRRGGRSWSRGGTDCGRS